MDHFHKFLQPGDYVCIEDTYPDIPSHEDTEKYEQEGFAKYLPVKKWLENHRERYKVDTFYNDFYG